MNVHELPMIIFTVLGQMSVGAFIALGIINLVGPLRYDRATIARVTDPAIYAIGPTLIFGMIASMFHMNDVFNVLNVFRHWNSSWLSREIIFGVGFAAAGFLFAILHWFKVGTNRLRTIIAWAAAALGIGLVWSMSQIYASLVTVPAWNTWVVPFQFFATTILLGSLAVGSAIMIHTSIRFRNSGVGVQEQVTVASSGGRVATLVRNARGQATDMARSPVDPASPDWAMATQVVRWISIVAAGVGAAILLSYIFHLQDLAMGNETAQTSATAFTGSFFVIRLVLLAIASIMLAIFAFRTASEELSHPGVLTAILVTALCLAVVAEFMGRSLHYDSMMRIGM